MKKRTVSLLLIFAITLGIFGGFTVTASETACKMCKSASKLLCPECDWCADCDTYFKHCDVCGWCRYDYIYVYGGDWCNDCDKCKPHCSDLIVSFKKGCILPGHNEPDIFDALEILKFLVNMTNEISKGGENSAPWKASMIVSGGSGGPTIFDALEILKYLVGMPNEIGVNPRPSSPANLKAVAGNGQVTITWNAPSSNGGKSIIRYEVSSNGGSTWTNVSSSTFSHTFTGLTNGTTYNFSVRAVNSTHTGGAATVSATPKAPVVYKKPDFWHSDVSRVGFWKKGEITMYSQILGEVSSGFNFTTRLNEARNQWTSALDVKIVSHSMESSADVSAYGGRKAAVQAHSGNYDSGWAGICIYTYSHTPEDTVNINGSKNIYRLGKSRLYFIDRITSGTWTTSDVNRIKCVITHELGHALGYMGHPQRVSANSSDVMWYMEHEGHTLRDNEKRHLFQVYSYYNR